MLSRLGVGACPAMCRLTLLVLAVLVALQIPAAVSTTVGFHVTVDPATPAGGRGQSQPPVPPNFVSLSMETPTAPLWLGNAGWPRRSLARALLQLKMLTPAAVQGPALRIGGNSADCSCWQSIADANSSCLHDGARVQCCSYNISDIDMASYAAFAGLAGGVFSELNASVVLTTNLGYGPDSARAAAEVAHIPTNLWPRVSGLEIGNEVASFGKRSGGHRAYPYTFDMYSADITAYTALFRRSSTLLPPKFLQAAVFAHPYDFGCGPDEHGNPGDPSLMPKFLKAHAGAVNALCIHSYALTSANRSRDEVSLASLLSPAASVGHAATYTQMAMAAHEAGLPLVIGEGNSVSQGGVANISDVFGSALWASDFLSEISKVGAVRHNFHGGLGGHYTMLAFDSAKPDAQLQARPLYYGALVFSTLVANHSRWVASRLSFVQEQQSNQSLAPNGSATGSMDPANVAQHAAVDSYGRLKVLLIGKEVRAGPKLPFSVRVAGGANRYEHKMGIAVERLLPNNDKGVMSKYGDRITFAGQTWDGSSDGGPVGQRLVQLVDALVDPGGKDLVVNIQVGRASAALLTFEPNSREDSSL